MARPTKKGMKRKWSNILPRAVRMFEVMKTEKFAVAFSAIIGFAIVALAIPACKGDNCILKKAPSIQEMKESTFRIGSKCYQFRPQTVDCPASGAIEAFQMVKRV